MHDSTQHWIIQDLQKILTQQRRAMQIVTSSVVYLLIRQGGCENNVVEDSKCGFE